YGAVADLALVAARDGDRVRGFLVDLRGEGVRVEPVSTLGGDHRAVLHLDGAPVAAGLAIDDLGAIVTRAAVARTAYVAGIGEAVLDACMQAHQVHGAIGFTDEYDLQLFSRRARVWLPEYGAPDAQRERIAQAETVGYR